MWPNGLGVMLYNGANGLLYYSSQAARLFVSNAGIIATVAVSGYFFPEETAVGVASGVAIRGATWLTKKVKEEHQVHLADGLSKLLDVAPQSVIRGYLNASSALASPQKKVSTQIATNPRLHWVNDSLATELVSPMLEEGIFRAGLQQGLATGLTALGVPQIAASVLALGIASSLFAAGHNANPDDPQHRDTLISGIGFGLMMYMHGMPAAVVAHAANNAGVRLEIALRG